MRKLLIIFFVPFSLGLLLISFIAYANQTSISNYYPSPSGNYTKVHLVSSTGGSTESAICTQQSGGVFINAGSILADPTTGYLEVCKKDGTIATYPGSCFTRFANTGTTPSCPNNYQVSSSTAPNFGAGGIVSWYCCFTGQGASAVSPANSGCFSIYSNAPTQPAACNSASGNPNAYDVGCDVIASSDMSTNVFKRNCCFNNSSGTYTLGSMSTCTCVPNTCSALGDTCGAPPNGCGSTLSCGTCTACTNSYCAATYQCACTPNTCGSLGDTCGTPPDGCCGTLASCGTCTQYPNSYCDATFHCACAPNTCGSLGDTCGSPSDGCGGFLSCGSCTACTNSTCSNPAGGTCTCTPSTCASLGDTCGTPPDGCCGTLPSCGACTQYPNSTCSNPAGGTCICNPSTCGSLGDNCGTPPDGCGGTLASCGTCTGTDTCGGGGTPYVCGGGCPYAKCLGSCCPSSSQTECDSSTGACCAPGACTPTWQCGASVPGTDACGNACTTSASCSGGTCQFGPCPTNVACDEGECEWQYTAAPVTDTSGYAANGDVFVAGKAIIQDTFDSWEVCGLTSPFAPVTSIDSFIGPNYCDNGAGNYFWEAGETCDFYYNCAPDTVCNGYECYGTAGTLPGTDACGKTCNNADPVSCSGSQICGDPNYGLNYCCTPLSSCPACLEGSGQIDECGISGGCTANCSGVCANSGNGLVGRCCLASEIPCTTATTATCCLDTEICNAGTCQILACFISGTKILLANGKEVPVETLKPGDVLLGPGGVKNKVVKLDIKPRADWEIYSFNGGEFFVTPNHLFKTTTGWKAINPEIYLKGAPELNVKTLKVGDVLITLTGTMRIDKIEYKTIKNSVVYNPELDGTHEYYANGYLVHNPIT
jgi:hypothetical protein